MAKNPFQRKAKPWDKPKEETRRRSSLKEAASGSDKDKRKSKSQRLSKKLRVSEAQEELQIQPSKLYGEYVKSRESLRAMGRESDVSRYEGQIILNQTLTKEKIQLMKQLEHAVAENEALRAKLEESSEEDSEELEELREELGNLKENEKDLLQMVESLKNEIKKRADSEEELKQAIQQHEEELREAMQNQLEEQAIELRQQFDQEMEEQNKLIQIEFDAQLQKEVAKHKMEYEHEPTTGNAEIMKQVHNLRKLCEEYETKISTLETENASMTRETKLNLALLEQQKKTIDEQQKELESLYTKTSGTVFARRSSALDSDKNKRVSKSHLSNLKTNVPPRPSSIFSPVASKSTPTLKPTAAGVSSLSMSPYLKLGKSKSETAPSVESPKRLPSTLGSTDSPTVSARPARVKTKPPLPLAATPRRATQQLPRRNLFDSPMTSSQPTESEDSEAARRRTRRSLMFDSFITKGQPELSEPAKRRQSSSPPPEENKPKRRRKLGGLVVDENDEGESKLPKPKRVKRPIVAPAAPLFAELSPEKSNSSISSPRRNPRR